jgi:HK97 family phage major capsid protein
MTTTFPELTEVEGKIADRRKSLTTIFDEAKGADGTIDLSKVKSLTGSTADKAAEIKKLNDELNELGDKQRELSAVKAAFDRSQELPDTDQDPEVPTGRKASLSFGEAFTKSAAYGPGNKGNIAELDIDVKTLMTTTAGWAPETTRTGRVIESAQRPIQVSDIVPIDPTSQAAYVYMEETTFTNNAAEVAEGGTYGEAALALTEQSSTVRKVGVWLPVTDEQLEDEAGAQAYINRRLPFMLQQRLDGQILVGNGTAPNLRGVNNVAGIQTQAKGADPVFDAVLKGATKVKVTGRAFPGFVVFHPNDWQDLRLTRTVDGIYILGNPNDPAPAGIWGMRVVESDAQTENTAVVGDFTNFSVLAVRRGIEVQVTNAHSTFFVEGKQAIRADMRAALVFFRPAAFCTVTGI